MIEQSYTSTISSAGKVRMLGFLPTSMQRNLMLQCTYQICQSNSVPVILLDDTLTWYSFGGEVVGDGVSAPQDFDFKAFRGRNDKDLRRTEIYTYCRHLRDRYGRLGVVGYCFGGWSGFDLGNKANDGLIDCLSVAHPAWVVPSELDNLGVPTQIIAPEFDRPFNEALKKYANEVIPTLGIHYDYQHFPGVVHRFASQPKLEDEKEAFAFERAQNAIVYWLKTFL